MKQKKIFETAAPIHKVYFQNQKTEETNFEASFVLTATSFQYELNVLPHLTF